jgi:hypothetical protein
LRVLRPLIPDVESDGYFRCLQQAGPAHLGFLSVLGQQLRLSYAALQWRSNRFAGTGRFTNSNEDPNINTASLSYVESVAFQHSRRSSKSKSFEASGGGCGEGQDKGMNTLMAGLEGGLESSCWKPA